MSSKKPTQHEGEPSGIRKSARKRCPKRRQSLSPSPPKTNNIEASSKSTTEVHTVFDESVHTISKLNPTQIKPNSQIWYLLNEEEPDDIEDLLTGFVLSRLQRECESLLSDMIVRKKQIKTNSNVISSMQAVDSQNKEKNNCEQPVILPTVAAEFSHDDECSSNNDEYEHDSPGGSHNQVGNNCKQPMILPTVAAEFSHDDECSSNNDEYEHDSPEGSHNQVGNNCKQPMILTTVAAEFSHDDECSSNNDEYEHDSPVGSQNKLGNNCKQPMILPTVAAEFSHDDECSSNNVENEYDSPENEDLPPNQTESAKKFWSLVQPYVADVSEEDLHWLEDLVMSYSSKPDTIPPLGEHYTKRWVRGEMQNQQASSSSRQPNMKTRLAERVSPDVVELITRANNAARGGNKSTPIYQKVIAALLEHSNMSQNDIDKDSEIDSDVEDKPEEMSNVGEEFYGEQNIIKQLETLGLIGNQDKQVTSFSSLPHSSSQATDENDEILEELLKCDAALSNLQEMNKNHLTTLLERCHERRSQQKKKSRLQKLDNQILNLKKQGNSQKKARKTAQMRSLLDKRKDYLKWLQSCNTDPTNSDDSELSDEDVESDESIATSDDCVAGI